MLLFECRAQQAGTTIMQGCFALHSADYRKIKVDTLRQLLMEGEQSGLTEYDLESLINELDDEKKSLSGQ